MPKFDLDKYYASIDFKRDGNMFDYVCESVIREYQLEMRDIAKYIRLAKIAVPKSVRKGDMLCIPEISASYIYQVYVIPIMIGLKLTDAERFENFVNGKDCTPLLDFQKCFSKGCFVDLALVERYEKSSNDIAADIEKKIKEVYDAIFVEKYEDKYYRRVGNMDFYKNTKNSVMCIAGLMSSSASFDEE